MRITPVSGCNDGFTVVVLALEAGDVSFGELSARGGRSESLRLSYRCTTLVAEVNVEQLVICSANSFIGAVYNKTSSVSPAQDTAHTRRERTSKPS